VKSKIKGFRRTCEGLKHFATRIPRVMSDCFRRTCEGLKRERVVGLLQERAGFRRTCEGLKRLPEVVRDVVNLVSDGPVRD